MINYLYKCIHNQQAPIPLCQDFKLERRSPYERRRFSPIDTLEGELTSPFQRSPRFHRGSLPPLLGLRPATKGTYPLGTPNWYVPYQIKSARVHVRHCSPLLGTMPAPLRRLPHQSAYPDLIRSHFRWYILKDLDLLYLRCGWDELHVWGRRVKNEEVLVVFCDSLWGSVSLKYWISC